MSQVEGLHPNLEPVIRLEPVKPLTYISTITCSLREIYKSERIAVRVLAYFLSENTEDFMKLKTIQARPH